MSAIGKVAAFVGQTVLGAAAIAGVLLPLIALITHPMMFLMIFLILAMLITVVLLKGLGEALWANIIATIERARK